MPARCLRGRGGTAGRMCKATCVHGGNGVRGLEKVSVISIFATPRKLTACPSNTDVVYSFYLFIIFSFARRHFAFDFRARVGAFYRFLFFNQITQLLCNSAWKNKNKITIKITNLLHIVFDRPLRYAQSRAIGRRVQVH